VSDAQGQGCLGDSSEQALKKFLSVEIRVHPFPSVVVFHPWSHSIRGRIPSVVVFHPWLYLPGFVMKSCFARL
jgi:hypothetical protein